MIDYDRFICISCDFFDVCLYGHFPSSDKKACRDVSDKLCLEVKE